MSSRILLEFSSPNVTNCKNAENPSHFSDAGLPLYLTPYIESGDIETGRQLAKVVDPLDGLTAGQVSFT